MVSDVMVRGSDSPVSAAWKTCETPHQNQPGRSGEGNSKTWMGEGSLAGLTQPSRQDRRGLPSLGRYRSIMMLMMIMLLMMIMMLKMLIITWSTSMVPSLMMQSAGTAPPDPSSTRSPGTCWLAGHTERGRQGWESEEGRMVMMMMMMMMMLMIPTLDAPPGWCPI
jgi:hypothetical protein